MLLMSPGSHEAWPPTKKLKYSRSVMVTPLRNTRSCVGVGRSPGAIASGTTLQPFVLPAAFRPVTDVYVPVDLCNATNGRLYIHTDGSVIIQAEGGTTSNATCFTSLYGVSFVQ